MCVNLVLDKIEIWVYNVHRNPRGAFTPILNLFLEVPPRVFPGILSEYLAQKYSPELVNKDFGDFLVILYISMGIPRLHPAYPRSKSRVFFTKHQRQPQNIVRGFPKNFSSKNCLTLWGALGGVNFCTLKQLRNHLIYFLGSPKKNPQQYY